MSLDKALNSEQKKFIRGLYKKRKKEDQRKNCRSKEIER